MIKKSTQENATGARYIIHIKVVSFASFFWADCIQSCRLLSIHVWIYSILLYYLCRMSIEAESNEHRTLCRLKCVMIISNYNRIYIEQYLFSPKHIYFIRLLALQIETHIFHSTVHIESTFHLLLLPVCSAVRPLFHLIQNTVKPFSSTLQFPRCLKRWFIVRYLFQFVFVFRV
jgi:hypothetical protein